MPFIGPWEIALIMIGLIVVVVIIIGLARPRSMSRKYFIVGLVLVLIGLFGWPIVGLLGFILGIVGVIVVIYSFRKRIGSAGQYTLLSGRLTNVGGLLLMFGLLLFLAGFLLSYGAGWPPELCNFIYDLGYVLDGLGIAFLVGAGQVKKIETGRIAPYQPTPIYVAPAATIQTSLQGKICSSCGFKNPFYAENFCVKCGQRLGRISV